MADLLALAAGTMLLIPEGQTLLALADLDGQPGHELVVNEGSGRALAVYDVQGQQLFRSHSRVRIQGVQVVDLDGDGANDLVWRTLNDGGLHVAFPRRDWATDQVSTRYYGGGAALRSEGGVDHLLVPFTGFPAQLETWTWDGNWTRLAGSLDIGEGDLWIAGAVDVDGDGVVEVLTGHDHWRAGAMPATLIRGQQLVWQSADLPCHPSALGDLEGDGEPDMLCVGTQMNEIRRVGGEAEQKAVVDLGCRVFADLDGDSRSELVCGGVDCVEIRGWEAGEVGVRAVVALGPGHWEARLMDGLLVAIQEGDGHTRVVPID